MLRGTIPFDRYPGLAPLFHDFLRGLPEFFPDLPTIEAAAARGRSLLGTPSRVPAEAFRVRLPEAEAMARDLAAGRAVAVVTGHQVGLFTGPLFTITKAFDTIRVARQLRDAGVAAVPVFWALTDDHDLEEIARTARPGADGPEVIVLEGADRSNRRPVGGLPLPEKVTEALGAFRADARGQEAEEILEAFTRRYAPGVSYGEAFIETLFDLVGDDPLLVLDPGAEPLRRAAAEFFLLAARKEKEIREAFGAATTRLVSAGKPVTVAFRPDVFPFFSVSGGERRRIEDLAGTVEAVEKGSAWPSTDVLTRPAFKSFLMPVAASVLGASEIAYHAQALAPFPSSSSLLPSSFRARTWCSSVRRSEGPRKRSGSTCRISCSRCLPRLRPRFPRRPSRASQPASRRSWIRSSPACARPIRRSSARLKPRAGRSRIKSSSSRNGFGSRPKERTRPR
jgi:hypothetical protein